MDLSGPGIDVKLKERKKDMVFFFFFPLALNCRRCCSGNFRIGGWEILGYGFQDMVFKTWDLNFGA
jgi:hypothetical protein